MARILENASECNCEIRAKSLGGGEGGDVGGRKSPSGGVGIKGGTWKTPWWACEEKQCLNGKAWIPISIGEY